MSDLDRHNEQLAQIHQDFAYAVSHDLGAPLRQIASYVELLQMSLGDKLNDRESQWLLHLIQAADLSQSMLRGLLRYSRLSTRYEEPTDLDLSREVNRGLQMLDTPALVITADLPLTPLRGVGAQIRVLVQEMVGNACRHSDGSHIDISVATEGDQLCLRIADNGQGIAENARNDAMQLFSVLDRGHPGAGMGLGLPLCQRIMQLHNGSLTLADNPGGGLVVTCRFPLPLAPEQPASAALG